MKLTYANYKPQGYSFFIATLGNKTYYIIRNPSSKYIVTDEADNISIHKNSTLIQVLAQLKP